MRATLPWLLLVVGCVDPDARECMATFSAEEGYSLDGDLALSEPAPECATAAFVEEQCVEQGHPVHGGGHPRGGGVYRPAPRAV